jgi:hypothetical protein
MPHVPRLQAHRHQRIQRCKRTPHVCTHTRPQVRQTTVGQDRRDGLGHCAVDRALAWVSCHCVSLLHRPAVFQEEAHGVQPSRRCVSGNALHVQRLSRSWTPNQPAFAAHDNGPTCSSHDVCWERIKWELAATASQGESCGYHEVLYLPQSSNATNATWLRHANRK